ncbi:hypothetical protein ADL26_04655, partial [Thermoactinomyces vulgaris]
MDGSFVFEVFRGGPDGPGGVVVPKVVEGVGDLEVGVSGHDPGDVGDLGVVDLGGSAVAVEVVVHGFLGGTPTAVAG